MRYIVFLLLLVITVEAKPQNQGDTMQFWSVSYIDWPPLASEPQFQIEAVCRKVGLHCYIFEATNVIPAISQNDIDELASLFDTCFYERLTELYGPAPDEFDNDSSVFILLYPEQNWAGYFDPGNQMADSFVYANWNRHSNEREIIYAASSVFQNDIQNMVIAHEFGHMVHWQGDHSPEPVVNPTQYWEDAWIDEGFSTFAAAWLLEDFDVEMTDYEAWFSGNADLPLLEFDVYDDYNQSKLWMVYGYERFGGADYLKALRNEQLNGIDGYMATLANLGYAIPFNAIFTNWILATLIDDPTFAGGEYYFQHYNFSGYNYWKSHYIYPVATVSGSVYRYSADYIRFQAFTTNDLEVSFHSDNQECTIAFLFYSGSLITGLETFQPDVSGDVFFRRSDHPYTTDKIIMAVINTDDANPTMTYSYSAEKVTGIPAENCSRDIQVIVQDRTIIVSNRNALSYSIVAMNGKLITVGDLSPGDNQIAVSDLPAGTYLLNLNDNLKPRRELFVIR
ncbi:MAG: hypothetical protein KKA07_16380 [Bacteroidetes bacterium]|nr:hypothetical protein [Bacteroidota bacterium]MBU1720643.1 hypothetical protein [Bacteroidota bacterium]